MDPLHCLFYAYAILATAGQIQILELWISFAKRYSEAQQQFTSKVSYKQNVPQEWSRTWANFYLLSSTWSQSAIVKFDNLKKRKLNNSGYGNTCGINIMTNSPIKL